MPAHVDPSPTLAAALAALEDGDEARAEAIVTAAVAAAAATDGKASATYAWALSDLGVLRNAAGNWRFAITAMREACAVDIPGDRSAAEARCADLKILGELLMRAGQLDEAAKAIEASCTLRAAVYGKEHAGYAFGTEALAALEAARGNLMEARILIDATVANFVANRDVQIAGALALRAEIRERLHPGCPLFDDVRDLPEEVLVDLAQAAIGRVDRGEPGAVLRALLDVRELVAAASPFHPVVLTLTQAIATAARLAQDHDARIEAFADLRRAYDTYGDRAAALRAMLGQAAAHHDAGRRTAAKAAYKEAIGRADDVGDAWKSVALRGYGLFLAETGRTKAATRRLRAALDAAVRAGDAELTARARIALGISLQHGGDRDEAAELLDEAIAVLHPADPDALVARTHRLVPSGGSTCCERYPEVYATVVKEMAQARLPPGLIESLTITPGEGVVINSARESTDEEAQRVCQVIDLVRHEIEERAAKVRGG